MIRSSFLTYNVVKIAIVCTLLFFFFNSIGAAYYQYFILNPLAVVNGHVWQVVTYMFLHDQSSLRHLFINMFILLMFGIQVEDAMGKGRFLFFVFFTGIGAGLVIFIVNFLIMFNSGVVISTVGFSGVIYALLVAFAFYFPDSHILLFFIIPIRAKYMILIYFIFELYLYKFSSGGNVSNLGHLGGILFALVYFLIWGRSHKKSAIGKVVHEVKKKNIQLKEKVETERDQLRKRELIQNLQQSKDIHSLSDDDYQFVKYCGIMHEESEDNKESIEKILEQKIISDKDFSIAIRQIIVLE